MKTYTVWFIGTGSAEFIKAKSRKEAISLFAVKHLVNPSSYIQARLSMKIENRQINNSKEVA